MEREIYVRCFLFFTPYSPSFSSSTSSVSSSSFLWQVSKKLSLLIFYLWLFTEGEKILGGEDIKWKHIPSEISVIHQNLAGDAGAVSKGQNNRRRDGGEFGRCGSDQTSDRSAVLIPLVSLITPAARSHLEKSSPQSGLRNVRSGFVWLWVPEESPTPGLAQGERDWIPPGEKFTAGWTVYFSSWWTMELRGFMMADRRSDLRSEPSEVFGLDIWETQPWCVLIVDRVWDRRVLKDLEVPGPDREK